MDRSQAINIIESLYPPDSEYPETARIGQELLEEAKRRVSAWKQEPDDVLFMFASLCEQKEKYG